MLAANWNDFNVVNLLLVPLIAQVGFIEYVRWLAEEEAS